jgi:hypothetical protein
MDPADVRWSRNHFRLLALNAVWGIPRSGLVFQKVSQSELALIQVMPWSEEMGQGYRRGMDVPANAGALRRHQQQDFWTIANRFNAAGVQVTDPQQLLKD